MASTIRLRKNVASAKIEKLAQNVPGVTRRTLLEGARKGQAHIVQTMYESTTPTGSEEVSRGYTYADGKRVPRKHPGRYRSGRMIKAIEQQKLTGLPMQTRSGNDRVVQRIGTTKRIPYIKYQDAIRDMNSLHKGGRVFMSYVLGRMQAALREAGKDAEANRLSRRIEHFSADL